MGTIYNFEEETSAATDVAGDDVFLMHDTSAKTKKDVTFQLMSQQSYVVIADATTYVMLAANSGKIHMIPNVTSNITITLPTPAAGLNYEFWYIGAAADAQNALIDTASNTNYFAGGVLHLDTDAGTGADEVVPLFSDGNSNSKLTLITPQVGTVVKVVSDGTIWYLNGTVVSATIPTLADQ